MDQKAEELFTSLVYLIQGEIQKNQLPPVLDPLPDNEYRCCKGKPYVCSPLARKEGHSYKLNHKFMFIPFRSKSHKKSHVEQCFYVLYKGILYYFVKNN